nr:MAG TPA: hypothetical protein [Caudoviricetes sp.]
MHRIRKVFEVVNFVAATRRWYRQGKPERCRRTPRLPNTVLIRGVAEMRLLFLLRAAHRKENVD